MIAKSSGAGATVSGLKRAAAPGPDALRMHRERKACLRRNGAGMEL